MPGLDGNGPIFSGPMTGGGHGRCAADSTMAGINDGSSMGFGRGRGFRQGRGRGSWPRTGGGRFGNRPAALINTPFGRQADLQQLERQVTAMQQHIDALNQRIESLKTKTTE
jgi:hypothetical protein